MFEILEISNSTEMEIGKIIVIKPTSLLYKLFSGIYLEVFILCHIDGYYMRGHIHFHTLPIQQNTARISLR